MEDRSSVQKPWYELGRISQNAIGTFEVRDLLVRWNERIETTEGEDGEEITEYVYDCHRIGLSLGEVIRPGKEAVEYYLERAKDAIIAKAQALADQEAGFDVAQ